MAVTLGALMDRICIVGGLVPSLLIDRGTEAGHPGTNDLDVGLAIALLDDGQYTELGERRRSRELQPEQLEMALRQALGRGLLTARELEEEARRRGRPDAVSGALTAVIASELHSSCSCDASRRQRRITAP